MDTAPTLEKASSNLDGQHQDRIAAPNSEGVRPQVGGMSTITITTPATSPASAVASIGVIPPQSTEVPKVTGTDWVTVGSFVLAVLSFLVTLVVVWYAMKQQIKTFLKTIESQEKIAKESAEREKKRVRADILSKNRQDWIDTLRNALSDLVLSANVLIQLHAALAANASREDRGDAEMRKEIHLKLTAEAGDLYAHKSKIELLLNPGEDDSKNMISLVNALCEKVIDFDAMSIESLVNPVVACGQIILKKEWERVKLLEGYDQ